MAAMVVAMAAMVKAIILEAMILSTISHRGMDMDMDCLNREYEVQRFYTTGLLFFLYIYLFNKLLLFFVK